jgi:cytochrome c553
MRACILIAVVAELTVSGTFVSGQSLPLRPGYDLAYLGPPLADPVMQQAKETYVVMGCAYCHGIDLTPRGEAADLRRSPIVTGDVNGNRIIPLLKAGVPKTLKLSPMPQYSDLSDRQLRDLVRWIHYARQLAESRRQ